MCSHATLFSVASGLCLPLSHSSQVNTLDSDFRTVAGLHQATLASEMAQDTGVEGT